MPAFLIALMVAIVCVTVVVGPLLGERAFRGNRGTANRTDLAVQTSLLNRRAELYRAILELDFDYSVDKIAEDDYAQQRHMLMVEAVEVLKALEQFADPADVELPMETPVYTEVAVYCASCGETLGPADRFCGTCGARAASRREVLNAAAH